MNDAKDRADKLCATCGRPFSWRAKWARVWSEVRTCSSACKRGPTAVGREIEAALLALVAERGASKTACPSEAVRALYGEKEHWPADVLRHMRFAVNRLAARGAVAVLQKGKQVSAPEAKGPIRVRRP